MEGLSRFRKAMPSTTTDTPSFLFFRPRRFNPSTKLLLNDS